MTDKPLLGKIALITGASRGIGRALSLELAKQGAHIIALARTQGGLEELDEEIKAIGGQATLIPCDLKDNDNVDALGPAIYQRWNKLDILIGNAAILKALSPTGHITEKDWTETLAVNLTANWRLLRTLDPVLKRSDKAQVVFITDKPENASFWGGYTVAKAGLEQLAKNYADENKDSNIRVCTIDPGIVATRLRTQAFPGEKPDSLTQPETIAQALTSILLEGQDSSYRFHSLRK